MVLKLNNEDNVLSETAKKLDMYQKEVKFYRDISTIINVNVPKCYHIINTKTDHGVLLENLLVNKGHFDCDLNNNTSKLFMVVHDLCNMHLRFKFENSNEIIHSMKDLCKVNEITHYYNLINNRYSKFRNNIKNVINKKNIAIFDKIKENFRLIGKELSTYPLNFCHGDYKSPNIFYKENI